MDADAWAGWVARALTALAAASFLAWILFLAPVMLLVSILFGVEAYAFFLVDRRRIVTESGGYGGDLQDRVKDGSETAVGPGVSAGGIHLSYVTRSRWRSKR